ncbi:MAG: hypothetical protein DI598_05120 [Pseudopedobacter saltans]|uniref:Uncharacterized protein n=1 Tax=Pseudopedobacter saltans TaxID=151895 RepID=A0A2W5F5F4_9SPHI|nr:MAG: hypothetical protein DI598_05120 [Pseudopedobacter saltans]
MKKINLLITFVLCLVQGIIGQTKTDLQVTIIQRQDINFNYQTIEEMESDKIVQNAVMLKASTTRNYSKIYCFLQLSNPNSSFFSKLYIQQSNTKNPAIALSSAPQLIYSFAANDSPSDVFFDIKIPRQLKWIPIGNYTFTLIFSSMP